MSKWHKGPPPSLGWWPTRTLVSDRMVIQRDGVEIRWYEADAWSIPIGRKDFANCDSFARVKTGQPFLAVEWRNRPASWPKRSRT